MRRCTVDWPTSSPNRSCGPGIWLSEHPPEIRELSRRSDTAAESARSRGAPAAAAELLDLAIGLGGGTPQRVIAAAAHHFNAGEPGHARALLEEVIPQLAPGVLLAEAKSWLGYVRLLDDSFPEAADLLEGALAEAADDPAVQVPMLVTLSFALLNMGRT